MRRRTGAAGIAVAIAAIVPLANPAPAQDLDSNLGSDCRSFTYQEAVPVGLDEDPGVPDPSCPDGMYEDPSDDAPLEEGRPDDGRLDGGGVDDGRLDGGLPDGSGAGQGRPDESGADGGGLGGQRPDGADQGGTDQDRPGQSHATGQGPFDQGGIREVREADGGAGGAARPGRDQGPTISATSAPRPATTAPAPAVTTPAPVASPAVTPTLGTQGGLGGASGTGPSDWDIGIGLSFVTGAALAAGYVIRRRQRA
ncbi:MULTISPECIES: hypothetical protein [Streptomyces]|uniref:hypothetical protein n=1 Tax=Streptomyces TaxID=1883 RepID=UPI001B36A58E|nr:MULTISPECIES: hypothetical protein [unclassified Streptomyces]MBQ0962066.1 hypothetical protein [Streptomyces sp. RK74B]MBQ1001848.1 hypothetical protein [Streptomyces sp. RK23]